MPIWCPYDELSHAMRSVGRRLEYDGAPVDQLTVKCIGIIDIEVAEIAVIAGHRRQHGFGAMANHDAHIASGYKLPAGAFRPFKAKAERVTKI